METLYRKTETGRYKEAGYSGVPDLTDGIWLVQKHPYSKSTTSLLWKVGDLKRPVDVTTQAAMFSIAKELSTYLLRLGEKDSGEWLHAKEFLAGYLTGEVSFSGISISDLTSLILKFIANKIEEDGSR